jgi:hypothetical protein
MKLSGRKRLGILALLAMLAGCAAMQESSTTQAPSKPNVNLSGYPPGFQAGYADGCASVRSARKRDEGRFKNDALYAQGWRDGYDICKSR